MHHIKRHDFDPIESLQMGNGYFGPPPVSVHSFFIDGLLIDTGPPKLRREFLQWLEPKPLKQVYITHHHENHSGNVNPITANFKVPIYGSLGCSELVQGQVATSLPQRLFWGTPVFTDHVAAYEQSRLSTPKYDFELLPIPGHALDQVALFEPNQGWLFSADAFVSPQIKYFMKKESMVQQIQSLKKMARLDFDLLLCCHTPVEKGEGFIRTKNQSFRTVLCCGRLLLLKRAISPSNFKKYRSERTLVSILFFWRKYVCS